MNSADLIRKHCECLELPQDATDFVCLIWQMNQRFDDMVDEPEKLTRQDQDALIWDSFVTLPTNPFYLRHLGTLSPVLALVISKWKASDTAEREGRHDARSFVWRAGFYDVLLIVYTLVHGPGAAMRDAEVIMGLYGEKLDDYMQEFG